MADQKLNDEESAGGTFLLEANI